MTDIQTLSVLICIFCLWVYALTISIHMRRMETRWRMDEQQTSNPLPPHHHIVNIDGANYIALDSDIKPQV